ncbi:hypothetical protein OY671_009696, partial [Metschnikowia pulcherrima]
ASHHPGRDRCLRQRRHSDFDGLSRRRNRHHSADGSAGARVRPAPVPADRLGPVHRLLDHVRHVETAHRHVHRPRRARLFRRRDDSPGPDPHRHTPASVTATHRHVAVRFHGHPRPCSRATGGWSADRELQSALCLFHQRSGSPGADGAAARRPCRPEAQAGRTDRGGSAGDRGPGARPRRADRGAGGRQSRTVVRIH